MWSIGCICVHTELRLPMYCVSPAPNRLKRHFSLFNVPLPTDMSLQQIFGVIFAGRFSQLDRRSQTSPRYFVLWLGGIRFQSDCPSLLGWGTLQDFAPILELSSTDNQTVFWQLLY